MYAVHQKVVNLSDCSTGSRGGVAVMVLECCQHVQGGVRLGCRVDCAS